jgi:hypothetical protein
MCESSFATLEFELPDRHYFKTQIEARMAVFEFIEGWSSMEDASPITIAKRRSLKHIILLIHSIN